MLSVDNITKIYNDSTCANKNINFTVSRGEVVWISGATGSGKTTLLNILCGIDTANSGSVIWGEHNISTMSQNQSANFRLRHIGLVFQSLELMKSYNAFDNVALPLRYTQGFSKDLNKKVEAMFEFLNIPSLMKKFPREMSGGQQQRVALSRALICHPDYILGDEISSSLDKDTASFIYTKIRDYVKKNNAIAVLISHDHTISSFVDVHYVMEHGMFKE